MSIHVWARGQRHTVYLTREAEQVLAEDLVERPGPGRPGGDAGPFDGRQWKGD